MMPEESPLPALNITLECTWWLTACDRGPGSLVMASCTICLGAYSILLTVPRHLCHCDHVVTRSSPLLWELMTPRFTAARATNDLLLFGFEEWKGGASLGKA